MPRPGHARQREECESAQGQQLCPRSGTAEACVAVGFPHSHLKGLLLLDTRLARLQAGDPARPRVKVNNGRAQGKLSPTRDNPLNRETNYYRIAFVQMTVTLSSPDDLPTQGYETSMTRQGEWAKCKVTTGNTSKL